MVIEGEKKKSWQKRRKRGGGRSDISLQEVVSCLYAGVWVKAAEEHAWHRRAELPNTSKYTEQKNARTTEAHPWSEHGRIYTREAATLKFVLFSSPPDYLAHKTPSLPLCSPMHTGAVGSCRLLRACSAPTSVRALQQHGRGVKSWEPNLC